MTIKEVTDNMVLDRIRRHKRIYVANLNSPGLQLSFRRIGIWKWCALCQGRAGWVELFYELFSPLMQIVYIF